MIIKGLNRTFMRSLIVKTSMRVFLNNRASQGGEKKCGLSSSLTLC